MDRRQELTAEQLVNTAPSSELYAHYPSLARNRRRILSELPRQS